MSLQPHLHPLLRSLQDLQREVKDILKTISHPPSGIEMEVLSDVRIKIENIPHNIVDFPQEEPISILQKIYQADVLQRGFARIPGVMKIRNDIAVHHSLFFPSCVVGPPMY